jgi:hypothetical protein
MIRIFQPAPATLDYLKPNPTEAVARLPAGADLIGLLSVTGNVWGPRLGIHNANLFLHPDYLSFDNGANLECEYIARLPGDTLLTTPTLLEVLRKSNVCTSILDFDRARAFSTGNGDDTEPWVFVSRR